MNPRAGKPYNAVIAMPAGAPEIKLGIVTQADKLVAIEFLANSVSCQQANSQVARLTTIQLENYFRDPAFQFSIPLQLRGTEFQQRIWGVLQEIKTGQTPTYGELADKTASSPRAVGGACKANAVPIVIPCHRIIAKSGAGGYCGNTRGDKMHIKNWLLQHEFANQFNLTG